MTDLVTSNKDLALRASTLGVDLTNDGHIESGFAQHWRAVRLDPENWKLKALLAGSLVNEGRIEEAEPLMVQLPQNDAFVNTIRAYILVEQGKVKESLPLFRSSWHAQNRAGAAQFDYAFHTLLSGDLKEGFANYECRREYRVERVWGSLPRWQGQRVKKLLVWCEQGVGDCIQFARYIPWVATQVDEVIFGVPQNLLGLFEGYKKWATVISTPETAHVDAEVALMSLPYFHGTTLENIPPDPDVLNIGKAVGSLRNGNKLRVGIVWAGNPLQLRNKYRSIPFKVMIETLGAHPNFELHSLQCGKWAADLGNNSAQSLVTDLSGIVYGDWCATGAVVRELDVLIAPCTGVAHLAAALGVKTYLCLHNMPDWRWFMDREDSPWYPSVKIFRQKKKFDWFDVLSRVADDLELQYFPPAITQQKLSVAAE